MGRIKTGKPRRPRKAAPPNPGTETLRSYGAFNDLYRNEDWMQVVLPEGLEGPDGFDRDEVAKDVGEEAADVLISMTAVAQWYPDGAPLAALILDSMITNDMVVMKSRGGHVHMPVTKDLTIGENDAGIDPQHVLPADHFRESLHRQHAHGMLMVQEETLPDGREIPVLRVLTAWDTSSGGSHPVFEDELDDEQRARASWGTSSSPSPTAPDKDTAP